MKIVCLVKQVPEAGAIVKAHVVVSVNGGGRMNEHADVVLRGEPETLARDLLA